MSGSWPITNESCTAIWYRSVNAWLRAQVERVLLAIVTRGQNRLLIETT